MGTVFDDGSKHSVLMTAVQCIAVQISMYRSANFKVHIEGSFQALLHEHPTTFQGFVKVPQDRILYESERLAPLFPEVFTFWLYLERFRCY